MTAEKLMTTIKKYPALRDNFVNGSWKWIEGKQKDDCANGLWRVHDKLYNLTSYVAKHPGGKYWLEITKGTDITEAFESHHISSEPEEILERYFVGDSKEQRNYFFTYDENGFYRTLKKRVADKLKSIDRSITWKSKFIHDINLLALFVATIIMSRSDDQITFVISTLLAAQFLAWSANFSHNFAHQADNWRMYTANISLITWRDFRVFHVLSHHMYPNTYADCEVSFFEPYFRWIPTQIKTWVYKLLWIPFFIPGLYLFFFHFICKFRVQGYLWAKEKVFYWDDLLMLAIPAVMVFFGKEPTTLSFLGQVYLNWSYIVIGANILFASVFFNRGHHETSLVHQNDEIKSFDFGEFQLSTTVDRAEADWNTFTALAYFGEAVLHHLFPALDHSILPQLQGTLVKTCKEFDIDLEPKTTMVRSTFGQIRQLYRSEISKAI